MTNQKSSTKRKSRKAERIDRWDIYNNFLHGDYIKLGKACGCSPQYARSILHGEKNDNYNVILEGEKIAAVNLWKDRFCKLAKSQL